MIATETAPPIFASADPLLRPGMLIPAPGREPMPFPLGDPRTRFFYYARNGIFRMVPVLGLVDKEVLFPSYFHGVELEALLTGGARPRFYPVRAGMRVDPADVIARITPETRAVYLIHYAGFPGPVEELERVCRDRGLLLIEDCALSLLSRLGDRPLGSFGDASVFCIYKSLPTPNGGAVFLRSVDPAKLPAPPDSSRTSGVSLASFSLLRGMEMRGGAPGRLLHKGVRQIGRSVAHASGASYVLTGTQFFDPAATSLAMNQLSMRIMRRQNFTETIARRRRNYARLGDRLADVAPSVLGPLQAGTCPLFYPIAIPDKRGAQIELARRGVETVNFWELHHSTLPPGEYQEADGLRRTVLELPCHQDLDDRAIDRVAAAVRGVLRLRG